MITNLWTRFGRIDERDLQENRELLTVPWDASQPIDTLFASINRCKTYADAGGGPMADSFLTHSAFMIIEKTGLFTEACRIWRMKPQDTRTYAFCQEYFYEAHRELSKTNASGGYHSANAIKEHYIYVSNQEVTGKIYSDPTGKFIYPSSRGNQYLLVV
jgi:hypothetical protein